MKFFYLVPAIVLILVYSGPLAVKVRLHTVLERNVFYISVKHTQGTVFLQRFKRRKCEVL